MDTGDTTFILISAALVMFMTPGLALFYAGMVRSKNALATIMQSFIVIGVVTLEWILWGYSMAFGPDNFGIIGGLEWFGLRGVGLDPHPVYAPTIPHQLFMIYQCMFAVITPALITGAFAERMRFGLFSCFPFFGPPLSTILSSIGSGATGDGLPDSEPSILQAGWPYTSHREWQRLWLPSFWVNGKDMEPRISNPII